jgi:uncharacterized membrane protein
LLIVTHVLAIHTEESSPEARKTLERLEMKLLKGLAHPGAALMVITGIILVSQDPYYLRTVWLRAKLVLVVTLIILDLRVYFRTKAFHAGKIEMRHSECTALHGAIAIVFFCILILVLTKPFGLPVRRAIFSPSPPVKTSTSLSGTHSLSGRQVTQPGRTIAASAPPLCLVTKDPTLRRKA